MKTRKTFLQLFAAVMFLGLLPTAVMVSQVSSVKRPAMSAERPFPNAARPAAHPVKLSGGPTGRVPNDERYMALASAAGWEGAKAMKDRMDYEADRTAKRAEFERYLLGNGIGVYDGAEVERYMDAMVKDLTATALSKRDRFDEVRWEWFPLSGGTFTSCWVTGLNAMTCGGVEQYEEPIPVEVLELAAGIRDCYPEASFDVTRVTRKADPFMRVRYAAGEYVIAAWDEPGFGGKKK